MLIYTHPRFLTCRKGALLHCLLPWKLSLVIKWDWYITYTRHSEMNRMELLYKRVANVGHPYGVLKGNITDLSQQFLNGSCIGTLWWIICGRGGYLCNGGHTWSRCPVINCCDRLSTVRITISIFVVGERNECTHFM